MIVAKYMHDDRMGAVTVLTKKRPSTLSSKIATRLPTTAAARTAAATVAIAPPAHATPTLRPRPTAPSPATSSSNDNASAPSYNYGPPTSSAAGSSSSSATPWPDVASAGNDAPANLPTGDAYVSVSGGIPDGALYAVMAAVVLAGGFALWRRSRRK